MTTTQTPVQYGINAIDLNVSATPPIIIFDAAALNAVIDDVLSVYAGDIVVTEDIVQGIKSELAGLNKLRDRLAEARKQITGQIGAPLREFEAHVKSVEEKILAARARMDVQVKAYEAQERESRRASVQFIVDSVLHDANLPGYVVQIDDRWLNKTIKPAAIKAEVESLCFKETQTRYAAEAHSRAKTDRLALVELTVKSVAAEYGITLPLARFSKLLDLALPADCIHQSVTAVFAKAAETAEAGPMATTSPSAPAAVCRRLLVQLEYTDDNAPRVRQLMAEVQRLCTKFIVRTA